MIGCITNIHLKNKIIHFLAEEFFSFEGYFTWLAYEDDTKRLLIG